MTSFKRFESKPVVKIILIYDRLNLWCHRQFITIFYQFLHFRIEIIHGSHMYILFLPRVGLYVSFLPLADARGKTSWHKGLPVIKTIYTYGFHELFLNYLFIFQVLRLICIQSYCNNGLKPKVLEYYKREIIQVWLQTFLKFVALCT
jgi:hypothetical protein